MKKLTALLLGIVLILSLAACGKKDTVSSQEEGSSKASSAAATTAAPTTTEEVWKTDKDATADEVLKAMLKNVQSLVNAMQDKNADAQYLTLDGSGDLQAAIKMESGSNNFEQSFGAKGNLNLTVNTRQGLHYKADYETDIMSLLGSMFGQPGGDEETKGTAESYADREENRYYELNPDDGKWYYSALEMSDTEEVLTDEEIDKITAEKLFKDLEFTVTKEEYLFEGTLNLEALREESEGLTSNLIGTELPPIEMTVSLKLTCDDQKRLTALSLNVPETTIDLGADMAGLKISIDTLTLDLAAKYDEVKVEVPGNIKSTAEDAGSSPVPHTHEYSLEPQTVADNELGVFRIESAEDDEFFGFTLHVSCENKTQDKKLQFAMNNVLVNGYMADPYWSADVAAGQLESFDIHFGTNTFEKSGIDLVDEIAFTFTLSDSDDWFSAALFEDSCKIYPSGKSPEEIVYQPRRTGEKEMVVFDREEGTMVILETETDPFWGYTVNCYLENYSDRPLSFGWRDVTVNGYIINPYFNETLAPGARAYVQVSFSDTDLKQNNITEVSAIDFTARISDPNDFWAEDLYNEAFHYEP